VILGSFRPFRRASPCAGERSDGDDELLEGIDDVPMSIARKLAHERREASGAGCVHVTRDSLAGSGEADSPASSIRFALFLRGVTGFDHASAEPCDVALVDAELRAQLLLRELTVCEQHHQSVSVRGRKRLSARRRLARQHAEAPEQLLQQPPQLAWIGGVAHEPWHAMN